MKMRRFSAGWLGLGMMVFSFGASTASGQSLPMELEVGYRWSHVNGNEDQFRSTINERAGFLVRSFTLSKGDVKELGLDRLRIDVSELGAGPAGSARIETGKSGVFKLTLGYRMADQYSALPSFANPLLSQGILPGQHTIDRTRQTFDADLEILPGKVVTPIVGYSWNRNKGPGQTTLFLGQDEFRLKQDLKETEQEARVGVGFNYSNVVHGQVTQGWRQFKGSETLTLVPGGEAGNNTIPVLDQTPVSATAISRSGNTDVNTPFTNAFVTMAIAKRLKITGTYVRFAATSDGVEAESAAGSFTSFQLDRFFSGLTESVAASAKNTTWRGGGRAEIALRDGVDLYGSFQRQHREQDGSSLINTLYAQSVTFGGLDKKDLTVLLSTQNTLERQTDDWNVGISARSLGPFSVRGGYTESDGHVTVTPDLSEIVVTSAGGEGGTFDRRVRTVDLGMTFKLSGLTVFGSWKKDQANVPVFRTDFLGRERFRIRAAYATAGNEIKGGISLEQTSQDSSWTGASYSGTSRQYTGDLEVAPVPALRLRGSLSQFQGDNTATIRVPQNYNIESSIHTERGDAFEGGVSLILKPVTLDAAIGRFENKGSNPFNIDRARVQLAWDIVPKAGIVAEYARDKYREATPSLGDFDATRVGLYLRWRP